MHTDVHPRPRELQPDPDPGPTPDSGGSRTHGRAGYPRQLACVLQNATLRR